LPLLIDAELRRSSIPSSGFELPKPVGLIGSNVSGTETARLPVVLGGPARSRDAPQVELAEERAVDADDVPLSRRRVEVVDALGGVRAV
jgi:hypothetical protein